MSAADPSTFDSLALVNSFYGPGATACWYLTCLSCLISWTIHPKKQKTDSITSDFIAVVTFPTVAAAHLIAQVQSYPDQVSLGDGILQQENASLSASLTITETYLAICTVLLLPTVLCSSVKRICLVAVTGVFCISSETYLFFAIPSARDTPGAFPRSFIIESLPLLVGALVIVCVLVGILLSFLYLVFDYSRLPPAIRPPADAEPELVEIYNQVAEMKCTAAMARMAYWSLPFNFLGGLISFSSFAKDILPPITTQVQQPAATLWQKVLDEFFPKTDTGIKELDQAVALLAGMTVLGFSLYSAADERYKAWWEEETKRKEEALREAVRVTTPEDEWTRRTALDRAANGRASEEVEMRDLRPQICAN